MKNQARLNFQRRLRLGQMNEVQMFFPITTIDARCREHASANNIDSESDADNIDIQTTSGYTTR